MTSQEITANIKALQSSIIDIIKSRDTEKINLWIGAFEKAEEYLDDAIIYNNNQKSNLEKGVGIFPQFEDEIKKVNITLSYIDNMLKEVKDILWYLRQVKF